MRRDAHWYSSNDDATEQGKDPAGGNSRTAITLQSGKDYTVGSAGVSSVRTGKQGKTSAARPDRSQRPPNGGEWLAQMKEAEGKAFEMRWQLRDHIRT